MTTLLMKLLLVVFVEASAVESVCLSVDGVTVNAVAVADDTDDTVSTNVVALCCQLCYYCHSSTITDAAVAVIIADENCICH